MHIVCNVYYCNDPCEKEMHLFFVECALYVYLKVHFIKKTPLADNLTLMK